MKRLIYSILSAVSICFLFMYCEKDGEYLQDTLKGKWEIVQYTRSEIYADGTEKILLDEKNIGYWHFYESDKEFERAKHILQYDFEYNGTPASKVEKAAVFLSDEGKRLIIPQAHCAGIGCDDAYTIKSIHHKKMVLELFKPADASAQVVYKLRMELFKP